VQWEYFRALVGQEGKKVKLDLREARLWEKITDWELSGYPIRVECGERDRASGVCVVVSRITWEKTIVSLEEVATTIARMNVEWQARLLANSRERLEKNTVACMSMEDIGAAIEAGKFWLYEWDLNPEFEKEIKEKYKATTRCIPFDWQFTDTLLPLTKSWTVRVIIARNF
jgi:prolyl-tRNA synthetase